jgi:hypothetical protein
MPYLDCSSREISYNAATIDVLELLGESAIGHSDINFVLLLSGGASPGTIVFPALGVSLRIVEPWESYSSVSEKVILTKAELQELLRQLLLTLG